MTAVLERIGLGKDDGDRAAVKAEPPLVSYGDMPYAHGMAVDRLSVTVPSELGAALRALAEARGATVSTVVSDAIAHQVRMAALDLALEKADRSFGPIDDAQIAAAEAEFVQAAKRGTRRSRRGRKRTAP